MIKAFVAPLKKKSIPRLELVGCLALAYMYVTCVKALDFAKAQDWERFFWIDSSAVLFWIRTPPWEFRPSVSTRVAEIQETIEADQIRYIKSDNNPADALTRGIHLKSSHEVVRGTILPRVARRKVAQLSKPRPSG